VAAAALVTWLLVRALLLAELTGGVRAAWEEWRSAPPGYGSIWLAPQLLEASRPDGRHWWFPFGAIGTIGGRTASAVSLVLVLVLIGSVAVWVLRGPGLPGAVSRWSAFGGSDVRPAARIALALLAGALVLSTSLPVQASLLVLPLVALAGLRWRDHLLWATTECAYFVGVWLYIAAQSEPDRGLPASIYLPLLLARLLGLGWLAVQALRAPAPVPAAA
jgi:hypothetical protein